MNVTIMSSENYVSGMDKEVLEVVLKKSIKDSSIKRIIDLKSESAVPKGENYTSTIFKFTLKVVLGKGRIAKRTLIAKQENTGRAADQFRDYCNLFQTEALVYTNILTEMEYLMEEFGDSEGRLWCEFIHYSRTDSLIILEDLKASGFEIVKRTQLQDLDHAKLALRSLGRYHAMAKVLEDRGIISKDGYKPNLLLFDDSFIRKFLYGGKLALIKGMKASWGEGWTEIADKLSQMPLEEFLKRIRNCGNFDDNTFKCLNHGDCWNNNIMFKHDWQGRPVDIRFIDYQMAHHNSPCVDLAYYMFSSIQPDVRHQNYNRLMELYHESLDSSLDRFGYKGSKPSLGDIERAMEQMTFFGLTLFITGCPIDSTKSTDAVDLDKVFETNGEEGFNLSIYSEDGLIDKLSEDLKKLVKMEESR